MIRLHVRARDQRDGDDGEHGLKDHEGEGGNGQALFDAHANARQAQEVQAADEAADVFSEDQGVAVQDPLQAYDAHHGKAEDDRGDGVLLSDHAPVEEAHAGDHDQDQSGADEHPGVVSGIDGGIFRRSCACQQS